MKGKDIIVIGALAAGAYLLLGGSGLAGGGTEGGGGKKATVVTGSLVGNPTNAEQAASYNPAQGSFQPSQYLLDLMNGQQNMAMTPLSPQATSRLWSNDSGVSRVLADVKKQGATVYSQPKLNDSRMVDYYVEIGGKTGLQPTTVSSKKSSSSSSRNTPVKNYAQSGSPGGF